MSIIGIIIITYDRISPASMSSAEKYMHGFQIAMAFVAFIMTIALISSVWIDRRKASYPASHEEEILTEP